MTDKLSLCSSGLPLRVVALACFGVLWLAVASAQVVRCSVQDRGVLGGERCRLSADDSCKGEQECGTASESVSLVQSGRKVHFPITKQIWAAARGHSLVLRN